MPLRDKAHLFALFGNIMPACTDCCQRSAPPGSKRLQEASAGIGLLFARPDQTRVSGHRPAITAPRAAINSSFAFRSCCASSCLTNHLPAAPASRCVRHIILQNADQRPYRPISTTGRRPESIHLDLPAASSHTVSRNQTRTDQTVFSDRPSALVNALRYALLYSAGNRQALCADRLALSKHPLRLNTINNATTGANQREQDLPVAIVNTPFTQKCAQRHLRA